MRAGKYDEKRNASDGGQAKRGESSMHCASDAITDDTDIHLRRCDSTLTGWGPTASSTCLTVCLSAAFLSLPINDGLLACPPTPSRHRVLSRARAQNTGSACLLLLAAGAQFAVLCRTETKQPIRKITMCDKTKKLDKDKVASWENVQTFNSLLQCSAHIVSSLLQLARSIWYWLYATKPCQLTSQTKSGPKFSQIKVAKSCQASSSELFVDSTNT